MTLSTHLATARLCAATAARRLLRDLLSAAVLVIAGYLAKRSPTSCRRCRGGARG